MAEGGCWWPKKEAEEGRDERGTRESARERRETEVQHRGLVRVVVAMDRGGRRWPEGVVVVGAAERERERGEGVAEAQGWGRRRVCKIRTLNKPYGVGC